MEQFLLLWEPSTLVKTYIHSIRSLWRRSSLVSLVLHRWVACQLLANGPMPPASSLLQWLLLVPIKLATSLGVGLMVSPLFLFLENWLLLPPSHPVMWLYLWLITFWLQPRIKSSGLNLLTFLLSYFMNWKKGKEDLDEEDKEKLKKRKVDRIWANWLSRFFIYAVLISQAQPWHAASLWQYVDILCKAYTSFSGPSWVCYSEEFGMRVALNPALRWDQIHPQLWLQVMTARPSFRDHSDSGRSPSTQSGQNRFLCWELQQKAINFSMNSQFVGAPIHSQLAPKPRESLIPDDRVVLDLGSPINLRMLEELLAGYTRIGDKQYLLDGFRYGFRISFEGSRFPFFSEKLGMEHVVREKLRKERDEGRILGPFPRPPLHNLHVSPLGVVPKKATGEF